MTRRRWLEPEKAAVTLPSEKPKAKRTRCSLFSDGKHRILVSPKGVRGKCICGAAR